MALRSMLESTFSSSEMLMRADTPEDWLTYSLFRAAKATSSTSSRNHAGTTNRQPAAALRRARSTPPAR